MNKIKAAFYVFYKSISSSSYYNDVVKVELKFSLKYFAVLALLASAIAFPRIAIPITTDLKDGITTFKQTLINAYPEDLVVTVKEGELSINQPEPYIFKMPERASDEVAAESTEEVPTNLLVIDTDGTLNDLETHETLILINKTNVLVRGTNKIEVYPLKDYPDGEITKENAQAFVDEIGPFLKALPYIVLAFALLGTIIYYFGLRLIYLAFVALVLMIIGSLRGMKLKYSKYYQIGIHAISLPLLIEVLAGAFNFPINYPYWFLALTIIISLLAILRIDKSDVDDAN
jgi:hypothetical protein